MLPGVAPVELVIARNARAAVYVGRCAAFPAGFEIDVRVILKDALTRAETDAKRLLDAAERAFALFPAS